MKRNINIGNINEEFTHFWAGSLDSHNFLNKEKLKKTPTLIDAAINTEFEEYNSMYIALLKKFNMMEKGRYLVNVDGNEEIAKKFWEEYEEKRTEFAFKIYQNSVIFNKDQVNTIFNTVWYLAGDISKKYNCPFKGFRFAINANGSVRRDSASVCTLDFLWKTHEETWEAVLKKCLETFAFYVFVYSEDKNISEIRREYRTYLKNKDKWIIKQHKLVKSGKIKKAEPFKEINPFKEWFNKEANDLIVGKFTYLTQLWGD